MALTGRTPWDLTLTDPAMFDTRYSLTPGPAGPGVGGAPVARASQFGSGTPEDPWSDYPLGGGGGRAYPALGGLDAPHPSTTGGGTADFQAQEYGPLTELQGQYRQALGEFDPATDKGAIRLGQDIRDLASGQRSERMAGYAARGLRGAGDVSDLLERQSSDATTRSAARAMADYRFARGNEKLRAIAGGTGVMGAPAELALREKEFAAGIRQNEANLALQQANQTLTQYMALLSANRSSPIYGEATSPLTGGSSTVQTLPGGVQTVGTIVGGAGMPSRPGSIFL